MPAIESFRPDLTEKTVEQALEAIRTGQPLPNDHPLRFFLVILSRLRSPEMLTGDVAVQVAVFNYLIEIIDQQRQHLRSVCGLTTGEQELESDFQQGNTELEAWSVLYHRYVRIERGLTMQLIAHHANQDERTLRRRHSLGIARLTFVLINDEQEARRLNMRQRLKLALPTIYPPVLLGAESLLATSEHIITEVEPPRHLILYGPAGIGKTSLALVLAHKLAEAEAVEDILWINLRGFPVVDLNALIYEIVLRIGLPKGETASPVQILRAYCFIHSILFVFDEAEQLLEEPSQIEALLQMLDMARIIITSRSSAPSACWLYSITVPELSRETAYKLLEQLETLKTEEALRSFDSIWSTVGGNPLALKLIVGSTRYLPLSGALQSVEISHLYDQIWDSLTPKQRQVLLLTVLFRGNAVPYSAFHALLPGDFIDETIEALVSKSLLVSQQENEFFYTTSALMGSLLLDKVRQGKEEQAFLQELLSRQVSFLAEYPVPGSALATLEIAGMLGVDSESRCGYACALAPQIIESGLWHAWFNTLCSIYQESIQKARLACLMGEALRWLGEFDRAEVYLRKAADFAEQRPSALVELSVIARYRGYWEEALHLAQEALGSFTQDGNITGIDRCIHEISQIALESGDAIAALTWLSRLQERTSRSWGIACQAYLLLGEYEEALSAAEKALTLLPASHPNRGRALATLGQVCYEMGKVNQAIEHLLLAIDLLDQAKDTLGYARASNNLAIAYLNQSSNNLQIPFEKIHQLLQRALDVQSYIHDEIGLAVSRQNLSWLEKLRTG